MRASPALGAVLLALALAPATQSLPQCLTTGANGNVPQGAPAGQFGNGRLATRAYGVIGTADRIRNADGSMSVTFPWWGAPGVADTLVIGGHRRNSNQWTLTADVTPGMSNYNTNRFWAATLRFPTPGCWRVVGTAGNDSLSLVVRLSR
jgi:hypothetical protein